MALILRRLAKMCQCHQMANFVQEYTLILICACVFGTLISRRQRVQSFLVALVWGLAFLHHLWTPIPLGADTHDHAWRNEIFFPIGLMFTASSFVFYRLCASPLKNEVWIPRRWGLDRSIASIAFVVLLFNLKVENIQHQDIRASQWLPHCTLGLVMMIFLVRRSLLSILFALLLTPLFLLHLTHVKGPQNIPAIRGLEHAPNNSILMTLVTLVTAVLVDTTLRTVHRHFGHADSDRTFNRDTRV